MRKRTTKADLRSSFSMSAGWLFADLLLVLAMLFLAANTMGIHPPPPTPTVTPTATPTPKILAQLEQTYHEFSVQVNRDAFLSGNQNAANSVIQQIVSQPFLQGRKAGLILVYGRDPACGPKAIEVSDKVYALVVQLGKTNSIFANIAAYHHLCNPLSDVNVIDIDIFLFAQSS